MNTPSEQIAGSTPGAGHHLLAGVLTALTSFVRQLEAEFPDVVTHIKAAIEAIQKRISS